jgi:hypothetical protein
MSRPAAIYLRRFLSPGLPRNRRSQPFFHRRRERPNGHSDLDRSSSTANRMTKGQRFNRRRNVARRILPGRPQKGIKYFPNEARYAQTDHTRRTAAKAYMTMKAELIAHFFFTSPPYIITKPTMVCMPTRVADVSCHAWSPVLRKSSDIVAGSLLDVFRSGKLFSGELK